MDHYLAQVEAEGAGSGSSMSSDDEDFNPDTLEAQSAKEEYDSEPTTTSSEDSDVSGTKMNISVLLPFHHAHSLILIYRGFVMDTVVSYQIESASSK